MTVNDLSPHQASDADNMIRPERMLVKRIIANLAVALSPASEPWEAQYANAIHHSLLQLFGVSSCQDANVIARTDQCLRFLFDPNIGRKRPQENHEHAHMDVLCLIGRKTP